MRFEVLHCYISFFLQERKNVSRTPRLWIQPISKIYLLTVPIHHYHTLTHSSRTSFIHCLYLLIQQWLIHIHHHYLRFTNPVLNFWLKNTLFVLKLITYSAVIVIRLFDWIHIIYIFSHHDHTYLCTTTNHHHNNTTHTLLFTYFFVWLWALYYQRMYRSGVTKMLTRNCFTSFKL